MADEIIEEESLVEDGGQSTWQNFSVRGPYYYPRGALGKFFARFFATPAQPVVSKAAKGLSIDNDVLQGDAPVKDPHSLERPPSFSLSRESGVYDQIELSRRARYREYEKMDEYPEVGAAFDVYADDSTQKDTKNERWSIKSESPDVVEEVNNLFQTIKLDRFYYDIIRNAVKFGDCFIEIIADVNRPKMGIQKIKILNPIYTLRVEDSYGYLKVFLQEIPGPKDFNSANPGGTTNNGNFGTTSKKFVELDKNQIVHFRLFSSDPKFYPYGKSVAAYGVNTFRSLRLMEDAMLIYRLARAPERRIFYIDVGNLPASKAEMFIERVKEKFKKEKYFNKGGVDSRYNPLAADEDFFVPVKGNTGTRIETLPGAQNLGETTDVSYFRDKLLASLKVPKDYIVDNKEKSPERKANLSELDVKFARAVARVQHEVEVGLEELAKRHLTLKEFPKSLIDDLRIHLPDPSDQYTKRKLQIDDARLRLIQGVTQTQLFPRDYIYKEYYDMSDGEIALVKRKLDEEAKEAAYKQEELNQISPGAGSRPQGNTPGGQEAVPTQQQPTQSEAVADLDYIVKLKDKIYLTEGTTNDGMVLSRIISKIQKKP